MDTGVTGGMCSFVAQAVSVFSVLAVQVQQDSPEWVGIVSQDQLSTQRTTAVIQFPYHNLRKELIFY